MNVAHSLHTCTATRFLSSDPASLLAVLSWPGGYPGRVVLAPTHCFGTDRILVQVVYCAICIQVTPADVMTPTGG